MNIVFYLRAALPEQRYIFDVLLVEEYHFAGIDFGNILGAEGDHKEYVTHLCGEENKALHDLAVHDTAGAHDNIRQLCTGIAFGKTAAIAFEKVADTHEKLLDKIHDGLEEITDSPRNTREEGFQIVDKDVFKHVGYWRSNEVDLEHATFEFWLMASQLFNGENCIWSLEWNTYGALFYRMLMDLNEDDFDPETFYRFNISKDGVELSNFCLYKKSSMDEQIIGKLQFKNTNFIPGIRFTSGNKPTACSLLKMLFEKEQIETSDIITLGELENFEDKNGNGTYKASYGHDDIIMTFAQVPMVMQTTKYKSLLEDMEESRITGIINSKWVLEQENTGDDFASMFNQIDQQLGFTPADSYSLMSSGLYDNNNGLDTFGIFQQ